MVRPWSEFRETALDFAIAFIAILPFLLTRHLPLNDLPDHLARQYILRDWAGSQILQTYYNVHWALVPNLALDIFVVGARQLMSIDMAVRIFCIITVLLLFCGTRIINRELGGKSSHIYRAVPLLCYGGPLQFGFLSFCFGIGLALIFFGLYLRWRDQPLPRIATLFVPCSASILLCHLAAFGVFAIAAASYELSYALTATDGKARRVVTFLKREGRAASCLLPAFLLFAAFSPKTGFANSARLSTVWEKAEGIFAITLFSSPGPEIALLGLAMVGLLTALWTKVVRWHRDGGIAVAFLALAWLILPRVAMGGGYIDYRIPWAASFFVLAALVPGPRYHRLGAMFGTAFGALAIARVGMIGWLWLAWEPTLAGIDDALSRLPAGAQLISVEGPVTSTSLARRPPLVTVAAYAVARRQAFWPGMFASISGQILYFQPRYKELADKDPAWNSYLGSAFDQVLPEYDYVLVLRPAETHLSLGLPLACEETGLNFELLKVINSDQPITPSERRGRCSG